MIYTDHCAVLDMLYDSNVQGMNNKSDVLVLRILIINLRQNAHTRRMFYFKNAIITRIFVSVGAQHLSETVDQNTASMFDYRRA